MANIITNCLNRLMRLLIRFMLPVEQFLPSAFLAAGLIPEEWIVIEDALPSTFDTSKLMPVSFLRGKPAMNSAEMRKRAIELDGNLSLADGKRMLDEEKKIPVGFRDFYISLPATILLDLPNCELYIGFLSFNGDHWQCGFRPFDHFWSEHFRFARSE